MKHRAPLVASGLGAVTVAVAAAVVGMDPRESLHLAAISMGAAGVAGVSGGVALHLARRRSLGLQMSLVALTCVGVVAAGVGTAAEMMFISGHDLSVLFLTLVAAVCVGVVGALVLGRRITVAGSSLEAAAERIGSGDLAMPVEIAGPEELARLGRRLEEMSARLNEAQRKERAMEASRRELIAWISHDLRTPLAGIRAMVEALEDRVVTDPETVARYHRTIRRETERLNGLVDDLFELSRINAGSLQLRLEHVSLQDLVSDALAASAGAARAKGVKLEGKIYDAPHDIELSAPEITRVLRNLLENAIRHTPEDGTVLVESGTDDERAFVSVHDSCGGIPEPDLGRVFDVAFTGQPQRSTEHGGAGLGLAIARGIVHAHNGKIAVENRGRGCRFTVMLPLERVVDPQ